MAEAVGIAVRHHRDKRHKITIAGALHPQTLDVVETRAKPLGIEIGCDPVGPETAALIVPWPDTFGIYGDHAPAIAAAKALSLIHIYRRPDRHAPGSDAFHGRRQCRQRG